MLGSACNADTRRKTRLSTRLLTVTALLAAGSAIGFAAASAETSLASASDPYSCNGPVAAGFSVTEGGSQVVTNSAQLAALQHNGSYVQKCDIDLASIANWPGATDTNDFTGTYDGGGFAIRNLRINQSSGHGWGLFRFANGATVRNLTLSGVTLSVGTSFAVGALVGQANDGLTIANVTVEGLAISGAGGGRGGLVGYINQGSIASVTISAVSISGTISGGGDLGSLVGTGYLYGSIAVIDANTHLAINGTGDGIGGLVGYVLSAANTAAVSITNSSTQGSVTGNGSIGGLIGWVELTSGGSATIAGSSSNSTVQGTGSYLGGLIGDVTAFHVSNPRVSISSSSAAGSVSSSASGSSRLGGLIGQLSVGSGSRPGTAVITDVTSSATVNATGDNVGGLIGNLFGNGTANATISAATATGSVSGRYNVGGAFGQVNPQAGARFLMSSVHALGHVTGLQQVGGLIAYLNINDTGAGARGTVERSSAHGAVTATLGYSGGLVAAVDANQPSRAVISESLATGDVSSPNNNFAGGLLGWFRLATLSDSYSTGAVSGADHVGGALGGPGQAALNTFTNVYSSGTVTGSANTGGLIGSGTLDTSVTVSASFWNTDTSGQSASIAGTGKTTAEMQAFDTFDDAGWSITNGDTDRSALWGICDGVTAPFLMWQTAMPTGHPAAAACPIPTSGAAVVLPPAISALIDQPVTTTTPPASATTTTVPRTTVAPAATTPPPVLVDGALPELTPGAVSVLIDGIPTEVAVAVEGTTGLVLAGDGFELRLAGQCTSACPVTTDASGRPVLRLESQGFTQLGGTGYQPGTPVTVWLFSEPTFLGQLAVNPDGTFTGTVPLAGIAAGEHTLQITGTTPEGQPRTLNIGVIVNPQPAPAPGDGQLPSTGTNATPLLIAALTLLGLGLVTTSRRRTA